MGVRSGGGGLMERSERGLSSSTVPGCEEMIAGPAAFQEV